MSIANELSCDVATAMLAHKETDDAETDGGLTEVVLKVHSTLRLLTSEARRTRRSRAFAAASGSRLAEDASGSH